MQMREGQPGSAWSGSGVKPSGTAFSDFPMGTKPSWAAETPARRGSLSLLNVIGRLLNEGTLLDTGIHEWLSWGSCPPETQLTQSQTLRG